MNRDISGVLGPVLAVALLATVVALTLRALRDTGAWAAPPTRVATLAPDDPMLVLEALVQRREAASGAVLRDPFATGAAAVTVAPVRPARPPRPAAPPRPALTAVVWDADPRALVRWKGRDWTVRAGGLFDEFQVVSISREQVVLRRGEETIILQPKPQGE